MILKTAQTRQGLLGRSKVFVCVVKLSGRTSVGQLSRHRQTFAKTPVGGVFHVGVRVLLALTAQAALGPERALSGNWLPNEEKITLLTVSIQCAWRLAEANWMQRRAGKRVILISVPKLPRAPLAAEVLLYELETQTSSR